MADKVKYEKYDKVYDVKVRKLNMKGWFYYLLAPSILLVVLSLFFLVSSIKVNDKKPALTYSETGKIKYKVYLKDNDYYNDKYLEGGMQYIASLINTVNTAFNYEIHASDNLNFNYSYKIIGNLKITDKNNRNKILFQKDYVLLKEVNKKLEDNNIVINEDVDIDYDKFNNYANSFRNTYGLNANAELDVKMIITADAEYNQIEENISKANDFEIRIPLTEQTIDISMDKNELNNRDTLFIQKGTYINNYLIFSIGVLFAIVAVIFSGLTIYIYVERFKYDLYNKELHRLLKNYNTYIVNAKNSIIEPSTPESVVRVENFDELLQAAEIEGKSIIFVEVEPDNKAYFVVVGEKVFYRFTLTRAYQNKLAEEKKNK